MSSTPRFFVTTDALQGDLVTLPREDAHHARSVLRLRAGEAIVVHDGTGMAHTAALVEVTATQVTARLVASEPVQTEPRTRVVVAQALPKNADKLEQVLQHGTEAGAAGFAVFPAARSVARLDSDKIDKRMDRWRGIVKGAAEQSRRGVLPDVSWYPSPRELLARAADFDAILVFHEGATGSLRDTLALLPPGAARLMVLVGPEGGFADAEVAGFEATGAILVSLGPRVLRTETAALVGLAQILFARE